MNSEIALINEMLSQHSFDFVLGYMTALSVIDTPPNNGIDYGYCVRVLQNKQKAAQ